MPVVYNDPRFAYEAAVTYNGTILVPAQTGTQPTPSGSGQLQARLRAKRSLTGVQPGPSGVVTARHLTLTTVVGLQPAGTGTLGPHLKTPHVALTGLQPVVAGAGQLTQQITYRVTLTGDQPAGSGQVVHHSRFVRTLTGLQPIAPGAGQLTRKVTYRRVVAGTQPVVPGAGQLDHHRCYYVHLTGFQPSAPTITYEQAGVLYDDPRYTYEVNEAGQLRWRVFFKRVLQGLQPWGDEAGVHWFWNPYIWAQYQSYVDTAPVLYIAHIDTEYDDVRYDLDEQALHASAPEVAYVFKGPRLYTRRRQP
jgi:hypothetical protein